MDVASATIEMGPAVLIVTGSPGAGKSTTARLTASQIRPRSVYLEGDWLWRGLTTGSVPPWKPEAHDQNRTVIRSLAACAATLAEGGFAVAVDSVIGPWHLEEAVAEIAVKSIEIQYVVLQPALDVALERATARGAHHSGHPALTDPEVVRHMWEQFSRTDPNKYFVLDNSLLSIEDTVRLVIEGVQSGQSRL
jgi:predicted kinase